MQIATWYHYLIQSFVDLFRKPPNTIYKLIQYQLIFDGILSIATIYSVTTTGMNIKNYRNCKIAKQPL